MEEVTLVVPAMWADHHVMTVRGVLRHIDGVDQVDASALRRQITIAYDPAKVATEAIADHLQGAGYATGDLAIDEDQPCSKPEWASSGSRVASTNPLDLSMSGDYRKY